MVAYNQSMSIAAPYAAALMAIVACTTHVPRKTVPNQAGPLSDVEIVRASQAHLRALEQRDKQSNYLRQTVHISSRPVVRPAVPSRAYSPRVNLSDAQIRKLLIQRSIDGYEGNCPCPYNTAINGSACGLRSAYSRDGGREVLCYRSDVTKSMISDFRASAE